VTENSGPSKTELDSVKEWLVKQGYPLELRVGQVLRRAEWHVEHGHWYTDPQTGKARETDLVADIWATDDGKPRKSVCLQMVIECKSSPGKPWVVFSAPHNRLPLIMHDTSVADGFSRDALWTASRHKVALPRLLTGWHKLGHGIVKAHSDGRSGDPTSPFAALLSVVSAAEALGKEHAELALLSGSHWYTGYVVVPLLVLDGALYEYRITEDGREELLEVERIAVPVAVHGGPDVINVTIVTFREFSQFVEETTTEGRRFAAELLPHAEDVLVLLHSRAEAAAKHRAP
jgi:hypothetical protein